MKEMSAGGVVYKKAGGRSYILMIEDRFGRWTLPKGKMEADETPEETALREIKEETNVEGIIEQKLSSVTYEYTDPKHGKVEKVVHYFLVRSVHDDIRPQLEEISKTAWLIPEQAVKRQEQSGYANNEAVLYQAINIISAYV